MSKEICEPGGDAGRMCRLAPAWVRCGYEEFPSLAAMMLADGDPAVAIWREPSQPECSRCDWGGCGVQP